MKFKERIFQSFLIVNIVYTAFSVIVLIYCNHIVTAMVSDNIREVTRYLKLETIGFIIANVVCFVNVLFVVLEKPSYIYAMTILKTVCTIIGDLFIGLFGGFQIVLDNIIYSAVVCKMVNAAAEQGNYWTANNIIWGLLLIPILALAEIIKKDCKDKLTKEKMKHYNMVILGTFLVWLCFIPVLNPFLKNVMGIENPGTIKHILVILIPFYLAYSYTVLFDNILIGNGKTQYCFAVSAVVNLV